MEVGGGAADEDAAEPVLEVETGESADAREGDIGLAGFARRPHIDEGGVEGKALGFVNRDRVGEAKGKLDECGGAWIARVELPLEGLDADQLAFGFDEDRTAREINHGAGLAVDERSVGRVHGEHDAHAALEDEDRGGEEIVD